ncbi:MAG: hypothetical protein EB140_11330, partial [Proteobacteria bacterium]|nr:hypothetical protein [Pseudomonadota bacterium]
MGNRQLVERKIRLCELAAVGVMVTTRQTGKGSDVVGTSVKHSRTTKAYPGWLRGSSLVASLAISLISGIIPASADTAPVTTPVAVASPE